MKVGVLGGGTGTGKAEYRLLRRASPSFKERREKDKGSAVDLVIVIGTSLTVGPVNQLISDLPPAVRRINISKTPIDPRNTFDI